MTEKVARFPMTGGLVTDRQATTVPPDTWTGGINITFREGIAERPSGYAAIGGACTVCAPKHLVALNADESAQLGAAASLLFYAGPVYAGGPPLIKIAQLVTSTATHSDQTPAAWGAGAETGAQWTGGVLNGIAYFNNPAYPPVDARAGVPFATLPNWVATFGAGVRTQALRHYLEFYVALGIKNGAIFSSDTVNWSARAAPLTSPAVWAPAAGNAAGNAELPGDGELVDAVPLGDVLLIYKRRAIWSMRFVGGQYIFDFKRVLQGYGALSQNCIAAVGAEHVFLTEDDVLSWSGVGSPRSLVDNKTRTLISRAIADSTFRDSWVSYMPRAKEIWVGYSTSTEPCNKALVIDLGTGHCGTRTFTKLTHATYQRERPGIGLTGPIGDSVLAYTDTSVASAGRIMQLDSGQTLGGAANASTIVRELLDFGEPNRIKLVKWVRPWIRPLGAPVTISILGGHSMTPEVTPTYDQSPQYVSGTTDKADLFLAGRFISLQFGSSGGDCWQLGGFDVGYELGGPA